MLLALQENAVAKMLKSNGFKTWDQEVVSLMNEAFYNMIHNELRKHGMRRSKQSGGKIVMPLEYFGVESGNFVESAEGVSVAPTADYIRPPIESTFQAVQTGGKAGSYVSLKSVGMVVEDVSAKYNKSVEKRSQVVKALKAKSEQKFSEVLERAKSKAKSDHLDASSLQSVISMKKYSLMH